MVTNNSCDYQPNQYNVQTGGAGGTLNNVAPSTSGFVLTSNGASSQPSFKTLPTSIATIDGDTGSVTGSTVTIEAGVSSSNCGSTVSFSGSGTVLTMNVTDGNGNVAIGLSAGNSSLGSDNVAVGAGAMTLSTAGFDTAIGAGSLQADTGGSNTAVGFAALGGVKSGNHNVAVGYLSGVNYLGAETGNILIGNQGTASESNVTRIGTSQTKCFIYGIEGVSVSNQAIATINTSTSQLGSVSTVPVANGGTGASTLTAHGVLIGEGTSAISATSTGASGIPLIGQGGSSDPVFGTAVVAGGGTGVTSWTDTNSILCTGTTSTGTIQDVASVATGQVLISAGTSTLPAWSATPTVTSMTFGSGTALSNYVQGTFTPGLAFGGASTGITYNAATAGVYTQIGNLVFFALVVFLTSKGTATGNATITGMPVSSTGGGNIRGFFNVNNNLTFSAGYILLQYVANAGTVFPLFQYDPSANSIALTDTNCTNTTNIRCAGFYFV